MSAAMEAAFGYARRGWPVFPLHPDSKIPYPGSAGFKDASTSGPQIASWWERTPAANVGIATGHPGPDVFDVDVKNGVDGFVALKRAADAGLLRAVHTIVSTPSGGAHYYGVGTDHSSGGLAPHGVDFKARGGYVVAPPSTVGGAAYELVEEADASPGHRIEWAAIKGLLAPERTIAGLRTCVGGPRGSIGALVTWLSRQTEGGRNNALFWALCRAHELCCTNDEFERLRAAALMVGLSANEVDATMMSARHTASMWPA